MEALQRKEGHMYSVLWHLESLYNKFHFLYRAFFFFPVFRFDTSETMWPTCSISMAGFTVVWGETAILYQNGKPWEKQKDLTGTAEAAGQQSLRWLRRAW